MTKPRVVSDCNVFLRAFISSKSVSGRMIELAEDHRIRLFVSRYSLTELAEVLSRPEFPEKFPHFAPDNWLAFLNKLWKCSTYIRYVEPDFELTRDKKDAPYIDLAAGVDADLLSLTIKTCLT